MPGTRLASVPPAHVIDALRTISGGIVDLLVTRERIRPDPFTVALRRYQVLGYPSEIGPSWRRALEHSPGLRLIEGLGRDLLALLAPLPRSIEVVAGPFDSAGDLDALTDAIAAMSGLRQATVELFGAGSAVVHVSYEDPAALRAHMALLIALAETVLVGTPAVVPWLMERGGIEAA